MLNSDSKKLRIFVQRIGGGGVSKAVWPSNRKHRTSTTTWRRHTLAKRWTMLLYERHLLAWSIISLLMAATIVVTLILHSWFILLTIASISTILTVAISLFLRQPFLRSFPLQLPHSPHNQSVPLWNNVGIAMTPHLPKTPRPPTLPLVRVLETFDLS